MDPTQKSNYVTLNKRGCKVCVRERERASDRPSERERGRGRERERDRERARKRDGESVWYGDQRPHPQHLTWTPLKSHLEQERLRDVCVRERASASTNQGPEKDDLIPL